MFLKRVCLFFGLMCLPVLHAQAKEKMIIAGLVAPPYILQDAHGNVSGILIDLIRESLAKIDIAPDFEISNWARAYAMIQQGRADALIPTMKTPEREKFLFFPDEALATLQISLMHNPDSPISFWGDFNTIGNYRIGRVRNARVSPDFDRAVKRSNFVLEERTSFDLLALAVANRRMDAFAGDELMGLWAAASNGVLNKIEVVKPRLAQIPVYLALSQTSFFAARQHELSEALASVKESRNFVKDVQAYDKLLKPELIDHIFQKSKTVDKN